jgi:chromosome segregation ATPase
MKKIVKLTENDLTRIVKRVMSEMYGDNESDDWSFLSKSNEPISDIETFRNNINELVDEVHSYYSLMDNPEDEIFYTEQGISNLMEKYQKLNKEFNELASKYSKQELAELRKDLINIRKYVTYFSQNIDKPLNKEF